ncbi:MAG: hypothetical protein LBC29_06670 [Propionibacteriaceae bacterium]|jgi:hypothetical protein|nr:hypothetical protein [Propionibacteriaceae bacterium]
MGLLKQSVSKALALGMIITMLALEACTADNDDKDAPTGAPGSTSATETPSAPDAPPNAGDEPSGSTTSTTEPASTTTNRPSLFRKPVEFAYTIGDTDVKITFWEEWDLSDISTVHPVDGSDIPRQPARIGVVPFSVEVVSTSRSKLIAAVRAGIGGVASSDAIVGIEKIGVIEGYNYIVRNGYFSINYAESPIVTDWDAVVAGDISNLRLQLTIAAGPVEATYDSDMPYRIFAITQNGMMDVTTYVRNDPVYGYAVFCKPTLGETVSDVWCSWH